MNIRTIEETILSDNTYEVLLSMSIDSFCPSFWDIQKACLDYIKDSHDAVNFHIDELTINWSETYKYGWSVHCKYFCLGEY